MSIKIKVDEMVQIETSDNSINFVSMSHIQRCFVRVGETPTLSQNNHIKRTRENSRKTLKALTVVCCCLVSTPPLSLIIYKTCLWRGIGVVGTDVITV